MRNWFRSWFAKPQRSPIRFKSPFCNKLFVEYLEDRITPAQQYLSLGNLLTFYGDFTGPTGSGGATIFTGMSATSMNGAIQIGPYTADPGNEFTPTLQVEEGSVMFDTNSETNSNLNFTMTGSIVSVLSNTYIPNGTTLKTLTTSETTSANDFVNGSYSLSQPFNYPSTTNLKPGEKYSSDFIFTISSIGIAADPNYNNAASLAMEASLTVQIPGGNPLVYQPSADTNPGDGITVAFTAGDVLYFNDAAPYGFDFSGASVSITDTFTFLGLTIQPTGLTFDIQPNDDTFEIYGGVTISAAAAQGSDFSFSATADFSTSSGAPGLQFNWQTGEIEEFDLGISGDFKLGGLQVQANDLGVAYDSTNNQLAIGGSVSLDLEGYTFTAGLVGIGGVPGLVIDHTTGQVDFNGLQLSLSNINLGAFSVTKASVTFAEESGELQLGGTLQLSFPGGWGAGGSFEFEYGSSTGFVLQEIGVSLSGAVPVGPDVFVTYINGELDGLGTQNWSVSGSIGVAFGDADVTIGGQTVTIVQGVGGFTLDKDELVLSGSVGFGAVYDPSKNQITSTVLGLLDGSLTLDWGGGTYSGSVNGSFLDGTFTLGADFQYSPGNISFQATAGLNVPNAIPLIGGDTLASANFVFEYDESTPSDQLMAAWVKLPLIGDAGIEYSFQSGDISFIGNSAVNAIESQVNEQHYSHQFTIPAGSDPNTNPGAGSDTYHFLVQWVNPGGNYYLTLTTPDGSNITLQNGQISGGDSEIQLFTDMSNLVAPPGQSILGIEANNAPNSLPSGTYTLTLTTDNAVDPNTLIWTGVAGYGWPDALAPLSDNTPSGSVLIVQQEFAVDVAFANQTTVGLYIDTDNQGFNGVLLAKTNRLSVVNPGEYSVTFTVDLATLALPAGTYYFYATVDDGFHPPVVMSYNGSSYSQPFTAQPQLTGTLTETGDGRDRPLGGWTVFIDLNGNGVFDAPVFNSDGTVNTPGEPSDITNADGQYDFYNAAASSLSLGVTFNSGQNYTVGAVLPPVGFQMASSGPSTTTFTYNGGTSTANFQVWQQATIAGTVFNDLNGDNVQQSNEPGVPNVTVYLDLNNDGRFDSGDLPTSTLNDGTYEFVGVGLSTDYTVSFVEPDGYLSLKLGTGSYTFSVGGDPHARYDGNDFGILREATISGTVTGNPVTGGQLGPTESLAGWTVNLIDPATNDVVATTTTDSTGNYLFGGLAPGNYTAQEVVPSGWEQTAPVITTPSLAPTFTGAGGPVAAVAVADLNNDGVLDYALFINETDSNHPGRINWAYGNGDGTFGSASVFGSGLPNSALDMQTGNFNGDAYTDLIVLGTDRTVTLIWGSSSGFSSTQLVYTSSLDQVFGMAVNNMPGAWDGDGIDDFVVYGSYELFGPPSFYLAETASSKNQFQISSSIYISAGPFGATTLSSHALAIGDLNNDGNLDLFMNFGTSSGEVLPVDWVAYGNGAGSFGETGGLFNAPDLAIPVPANGGPVTLGDLNGDGILDVVTSNFLDGGPTTNLYPFVQTSFGDWVGLDGQFASASSPALPPNGPFSGPYLRTFVVTGLAIADIDGDGKKDITLSELPTDSGLGQTITYLNQGNTTTGVKGSTINGVPGFDTGTGDYFFTTLTTGAQPSSMALGDLNNDGQVDVLLGDSASSAPGFWVLLNTSATATDPTVSAADNGNYTVDFANLEVGKAQVAGAVYGDDDGDERRGAAEGGLGGVTVYLDLNNNGILDPNEPFRVTNPDGHYAFAGLTPGLTASVRVALPAPDVRQGEADRPVTLGQVNSAIDLGVRRLLLNSISDATGVTGQLLTVAPVLTGHARETGTSRPARLVFTLAPGAPTGLTIDPATGVLSWVPGSHQAPGVYPVTVWVRDIYNPLRADTQTFEITVTPAPAVPQATPLAAGGGQGGTVRLYNPDGTVAYSVRPFGTGYTGGLVPAVGDVTGDGVTDMVIAAGPGHSPRVIVIDGQTGVIVRSFLAYSSTFSGGVSVAVGDVTSDGVADIITGAGAGGPPRVKVFDGRTGLQLMAFNAFNSEFSGGVSVAVGDVTGDGVADIITGAGAGGPPRVKVFDGTTGLQLMAFNAFNAGFSGGVSVAVGDVTSDGVADIMTGAGAGGPPRVKVFDGRTGQQLMAFNAFGPAFRGGVNVAAGT